MTIRALIIDDSIDDFALIRKLFSDILKEDPNIKVIGTVVNGKGGLEKEIVHLSCSPKELGSRPSVNVLFRSIAPIYGPRAISLIRPE